MHGIVDDWNTGSVWEMLREVPADRSHSTFKRPAFILFSTDSREPPRKLHRETDACEFRQDHSNNSAKTDDRGRGNKIATGTI